MGVLSRLVTGRTDLDQAALDRLREITAEWSLIADLAMSDLVLWLPTWNEGGLVAAALVRPTTAATSVPEDIVGGFSPRGRRPDLDAALQFGRTHGAAYPVHFGGRVIGVVARYEAAHSRVAGQLEAVYSASADDLLAMLVEGSFPDVGPPDATVSAPRVGDGLVRCSASGLVEYASPNAVSALRRLGVATGVEGRALKPLVMRLVHRPGPLDDAVSRILEGSQGGTAELENAVASIHVRGLPLRRGDERLGVLILLRDVTEIRRRERALVSKDATIREIHHRVKNNLQMVAALLRLQARRAGSEEVRIALDEAQVRVAAIAVVHEILSRDIGDAVPFDDVLDRILAMLVDLAPATGGVGPTVRRSGASLVLSSDVATPLAMCLAELVQNAIEHARAHSIEVTVTDDDTSIVATVTDDGVGLPESFDLSQAGLGLQIVQTMATGELGGGFEMSPATDGGTVARVTVPHHSASTT